MFFFCGRPTRAVSKTLNLCNLKFSVTFRHQSTSRSNIQMHKKFCWNYHVKPTVIGSLQLTAHTELTLRIPLCLIFLQVYFPVFTSTSIPSAPHTKWTPIYFNNNLRAKPPKLPRNLLLIYGATEQHINLMYLKQLKCITSTINRAQYSALQFLKPTVNLI